MHLTYLILFFFVLTVQSVFCMVRLPSLVSDNMVLQRDTNLKLWGWGAAGEKITVQFQGKKWTVRATQDGTWTSWLGPMKAGGPYSMTISGTNTILLKNIMVGDVWLCAGQSNMVHHLALHKERYAKEIAEARYPQIRHVKIPMVTNLLRPNDDLPAVQWKSATPEDVLDFSVVAYFFARDLYERYKIPIGLINASVGGTPLEAWLSEEAVKQFPDSYNTLLSNKDTTKLFTHNRRVSLVNEELTNKLKSEEGLAGKVKWYDVGHEDSNWHPIIVPGYWEDQGLRDLNGVVWYRKEINLANAVETEARIYLGRIVDADEVYINGVGIGSTTYQYPQRRYTIPPGTLKQGKNILVVRVINYSAKGGFVPDKPYRLVAGSDTTDLRGEWRYKVGSIIEPRTDELESIQLHYQPAALFNGMVAPIKNFALKGVIWYQGESNTDDAAKYDSLLPALISDLRKIFSHATLPFVYAQLPNFLDVNYLPEESNWARLREAQLKALVVPHTGMAVTIDLGEWNDIHPGKKKPVGERLALAAMHVAYKESTIYSGPVFSRAVVEGDRIKVSFTNIGTGLKSCNGEPLNHFAIAGQDKKFYWAKATIEGNEVVVTSSRVAKPLYVRYAWADNPLFANLCNKDGLPASPFRTDSGE